MVTGGRAHTVQDGKSCRRTSMDIEHPSPVIYALKAFDGPPPAGSVGIAGAYCFPEDSHTTCRDVTYRHIFRAADSSASMIERQRMSNSHLHGFGGGCAKSL